MYATFIAAGLYHVSEEIRNLFRLINELMSSVKRVFLKAPARTRALKEQFPGVPLSPGPVVTWWGTLLSAAEYRNAHTLVVSDVLLMASLLTMQSASGKHMTSCMLTHLKKELA